MRVRLLRSILAAPLLSLAFLGSVAAAPASPEQVALAETPAARATAVSGVAPILDPVTDMSLDAGTTADQSLHASDADGDPLAFFKSSGPLFLSVTTTDPGSGSATGNAHLAPGAGDAGTFNATVGVTDGQANDLQSFQISVVGTNAAPTLTQPSSMNVQVGRVANQQLVATDPNGDPLAFTKLAGPSFVTVSTTDPGSGTAYGNVRAAPTSNGEASTYAVTVQVDDGSLTSQKSFQLTVRPNDPPSFGSVYAMTVRVNDTATQTVYAYDNDGDPLTISKSAGPAYMTVQTYSPGPPTAVATITLTPGPSDVGSTTGTIRVTDGVSNVDQSFPITVSPADRPPVLDQPANMTVTVAQIAQQTVTATDADGDYLYIYEASGPTYMSVSGSSGYGNATATIRLAPSAAHVGTATGALTAYANGLTDTKSFTITVVPGDFPPSCGEPTFARVSQYYGYGLIEVQSADLNGDGYPDIVMELPDPGRAATALGNGDGSFGAAVDLDAGSHPVSGAVGDLNGDGIPDAAILDNGGGNVHVFLGDGAGGFGPRHSFATGYARSIVMADVNRDGKMDLLTADPNADVVAILRGNGDGTFLPATTVPAGYNAWHLATPDLNGDGAPDLVVANPGESTITVYRNNGSGSFGSRVDYPVHDAPLAVASADFDGNGTADVVVSCAYSNSVLVLPGDGTGALGASREFSTGTGPRQIAVADWNGDGHLDLAVVNLDSYNVTLLLGDGAGAFGARTDLPAGSGPYGIAQGDFDDDLRPDFVVANYYGGSITTYLNRCAPERDHPPVVKAPSKVTGAEGSAITIAVTASDPDGPALTSLVADVSGLPLGANTTFVTNPGLTQATFTWTPSYQAGRTAPWPVRFIGSNVLSDTATTNITVVNVNRAPVASAGGPYTAFLGTPVAFDATASSDPDGDALAYAWIFGDGKSGVGATPMHQYPAIGVYAVALTVSDGAASALATTTVTIEGVFEARAFTSSGNRSIRLTSGKPQWCVELEPVGRSYSNVTVDVTSIVMKSAGTGSVEEIRSISGKTVSSGDHDGNGVEELTVCFGKDDLRALFSDLHGKTTVTVSFEGSLYTGGVFRAQMDVTVTASGGTLSASISPNPLNPDAVLTFRTERRGRVRIDVFDTGGRLVSRLMDESDLAAGYHDVHVGARRSDGGTMASGVYFFRIDAAEGRQTGRFTILK